MSVSKFNNEGYYDPVVYEALTKGRRRSVQPERLPLTALWSIYAHHMQETLKRILTEQGHFQDLR